MRVLCPTIGITMGDPAGVGPEIVMKSLARSTLYDRCRPLVIGDAGRLRRAGELVNSQATVNAVQTVSAGRYVPGVVDCIDLG